MADCVIPSNSAISHTHSSCKDSAHRMRSRVLSANALKKSAASPVSSSAGMLRRTRQTSSQCTQASSQHSTSSKFFNSISSPHLNIWIIVHVFILPPEACDVNTFLKNKKTAAGLARKRSIDWWGLARDPM